MSQSALARRSTSHGFSVLETLVAVAVLGLVVVIGVPSVLKQISKVRLEAAANDVANLVRQTRLRAIRDRETYTVEVVGDEVHGQNLLGSTAAAPFEMEFFNPPVELYPNGAGIADCQRKYDGTGTTWDGTSITYDSTGVAAGTAAICVWDGRENILQVVLEFPAGTPIVRKFLKTPDSPTAADGFFERTSAATSDFAWTWY